MQEIDFKQVTGQYYCRYSAFYGTESQMEQRINELELRYMQQEQTIQELNEIVCRQDLILSHLMRDLATLKEQFLVMSPSVSRDANQEEPPPHY